MLINKFLVVTTDSLRPSSSSTAPTSPKENATDVEISNQNSNETKSEVNDEGPFDRNCLVNCRRNCNNCPPLSDPGNKCFIFRIDHNKWHPYCTIHLKKLFYTFFNHQYPQRAWRGVEINCLLRLDFNSDCHDLCGLGLHVPNLLPLLLQVLLRLGEERRQPRLWIILLYGWCDGGGFFNNHHKSLFI